MFHLALLLPCQANDTAIVQSASLTGDGENAASPLQPGGLEKFFPLDPTEKGVPLGHGEERVDESANIGGREFSCINPLQVQGSVNAEVVADSNKVRVLRAGQLSPRSPLVDRLQRVCRCRGAQEQKSQGATVGSRRGLRQRHRL